MTASTIAPQSHSRRAFLAGVGIAIGGTALASALPAYASNDVVEEAAKPEISEIYDCDMVVCGSGTSGLCAASHAAELGAKVIVVEALTENGLGGNSKYVESCWIPPMDETAELKAYSSMQEYFKHACNDRVVRKFCASAREVYQWTMDKQKVQFEPINPSRPRPAANYLPNEEKGWAGGKNAIMTMFNYCKELGVEFLFNARAVEAVVSDEAVVGVICERLSGDRLQVNASAVMFATGGYSANKEMFEEFTRLRYDRFSPYGSSGSQRGDGINIGLSLDASLHHPEAINFFSTVLPGHYNKGALTVCGINQADTVFFNELGERFCDEACIEDKAISGNICSQQDKVFVVVDDDFIEKIETVGPVTKRTNYFDKNVPVPGFREEVLKACEREAPRVVQANTIKELAEKLEIPADSLQAEIDKWNGYVDEGVDKDFFKDPKLMRKIVTAPFYAFKPELCFYNNVGGLKVDSNARVVDKGNVPIKGLYAGASDAGALFGGFYDGAVAPGSTQLWARTSGYWAAEHCVKEYMPSL